VSGPQPGDSQPGEVELGDSQPGEVDPGDLTAVAAQLGRSPRGVVAVAHRCPCGNPTVVTTAPRLADGTPFPTLYYLTCRRLTVGASRQEADGVMRSMTERLRRDPELAQAQRGAHHRYLAERNRIEDLGTTVSAGGMPDRVKCLHVLAAHALACGDGVNPLGDEVVAAIGQWWRSGPCVLSGRPD